MAFKSQHGAIVLTQLMATNLRANRLFLAIPTVLYYNFKTNELKLHNLFLGQ